MSFGNPGDKGKVQLWEAAIKYMKPPCVRHYHVKTPANMELFTPGGLHLLSERTTHKKIDGKPHLVYKGFSQSRKRNEALIERVRPSEADYVVEFWSYPPILPGKDEMDNLSLYLSTDATGDRDMEMNHAPSSPPSTGTATVATRTPHSASLRELGLRPRGIFANS